MITEILNDCPIAITPAAIAEIKRLKNSTDIQPGQALRIGVKVAAVQDYLTYWLLMI